MAKIVLFGSDQPRRPDAAVDTVESASPRTQWCLVSFAASVTHALNPLPTHRVQRGWRWLHLRKLFITDYSP